MSTGATTASGSITTCRRRSRRISGSAATTSSTGQRIWYHLPPNHWSVHYNTSPDGTLFSGDGSDPVIHYAQAKDAKWMFLFHPELVPNQADETPDQAHMIQAGKLVPERLVNLSRHDYSLEPNGIFTPGRQMDRLPLQFPRPDRGLRRRGRQGRLLGRRPVKIGSSACCRRWRAWVYPRARRTRCRGPGSIPTRATASCSSRPSPTPTASTSPSTPTRTGGTKLIMTTRHGVDLVTVSTGEIEHVLESDSGRVFQAGRKTGQDLPHARTATSAPWIPTPRSLTQLAKLPPGGTVVTVNADETLAAGSITERRRSARGRAPARRGRWSARRRRPGATGPACRSPAMTTIPGKLEMMTARPRPACSR